MADTYDPWADSEEEKNKQERTVYDPWGTPEESTRSYDPWDFTKNLPEHPFEGDYGPSDLMRPDRLRIIKEDMRVIAGPSEVESSTDQELVNKWLNRKRYGETNTVAIVRNTDRILRADEDEVKSLRAGTQLFENMRNSFAEGNTWGETVDAVRDYTLGTVFDPANLIGMGVGKAFTAVGLRAGAKQAAKTTFVQATKRGASKSVATQLAKEAESAIIKSNISKLTKKDALKEIALATGVDAGVAVIADQWYQRGRQELDLQEGNNWYQTGASAFLGLVGGGIQALTLPKGTSKVSMASDVKFLDDVTSTENLRGILKKRVDQKKKAQDVPVSTPFKEKVENAQDLELAGQEFWIKFLAGDPDTGEKGLGDILYESGFRWSGPREGIEGDNFSNWMADALRYAPEEDQKAFIDYFENHFKTKLATKNPIEDLANSMANAISYQGKGLGTVSDQRRKLVEGIASATMTDKEVYEALYGSLPRFEESRIEFAHNLHQGISHAQNTWIRLLVSHPSTSAVNVAGWGIKSTGKSMSDLVVGMIHTTGLHGARPTTTTLRNAMAANKKKLGSMLDPTTTMEEFQAFLRARPESMKKLDEMLPGGVVKADVMSEFLPDPRNSLVKRTDQAVDLIQSATFVKAQDHFTKAVEFLYNLDVAVRNSGIVPDGGGYRELLQADNAAELMSSKKFRAAEFKAVDDTLESIFSRSYGTKTNASVTQNALGNVAGFIEEARNIPGLGILMPFGRFFNNSMATVVDYSPAGLVGKSMNFYQGKGWDEVFAKSTVGTAGLVAMIAEQDRLIEEGIPWDETRDSYLSQLTGTETGTVQDIRYLSPMTPHAALARGVAHRLRGEEVPRELLADMVKGSTGDLFGAMTDVQRGMYETLEAAFNDEQGFLETVGEVVAAGGAQIVAGGTRFMEPVNIAVATFGSKENYAPVDPRQAEDSFSKNMYNALKYMDALVLPDDVPRKVSGTQSGVGRGPERMGGTREGGPQTYAEMALTYLQKPEWNLGLNASDRQSNAIMTEVFQPIFEQKAAEVFLHPDFKKWSQAGQKYRLNEALKDSREEAKEFLRISSVPGDRKAGLIFKITSRVNTKKLEAKLKEWGLSTEIWDMTPHELETIDYLLSKEDDLLEEQTR